MLQSKSRHERAKHVQMKWPAASKMASIGTPSCLDAHLSRPLSDWIACDRQLTSKSLARGLIKPLNSVARLMRSMVTEVFGAPLDSRQ
jgi:hypothetical protein